MELYVDGASKGNPGPAGGGIVLKDDGRTVEERSVFFGRKTNNQAEYLALIEGLRLALKYGVKRLKVYMDSELVVRQIRGIYKVKSRNLIPLWKKAKELSSKFEIISFHSIPRILNARADELANRAIEENVK